MSLYTKSKAKHIVADREQIKDLVSKTIDQMATVVGSTLGPGGRCVLIERDGLSPLITKDGVTVAKNLGLNDATANIVIEACKEICINTAKDAGDGTTTAIVLANAITKHGLEFLRNNPKYNPQRMVNELRDLYTNILVPFMKTNSTVVETEDELIQVATISANGDRNIAKAAVEAVMKAGDDGTVLIQETQGSQIKVETLDGYVITTGLKDLGSIGMAFINDRVNQQANMDSGLVFLYDGTLNDLKVPAAIQTAVEGTDLYGKPIVVIAHKFADVVLDKFAKSTKGGYTVVPIKTPVTGTPNYQTMSLHDLAAYTGGTVYDPGNLDEAIKEENLEFGTFNNAKSNLFETFIQAQPDPKILDSRINELKMILASAPEWDKMHIRSAIGKLTCGVSTIWVGGATELEAREKKARTEDAVEAVRSAIAEGVVPGGCGMHLTMIDLLVSHQDYLPSWTIMVEALKAPFNLLLQNCGEDAGVVWESLQPYIVNRFRAPETIFDADQHRLVKAVEAGIIEPVKVIRVGLDNALSVASLLITLGGIVVVPRDSQLENTLAVSKQAFQDMMTSGNVGQDL